MFVLAAGQVPADDAVLLKAAARVVLGGGRGALAQQLERPPEPVVLSPALAATVLIETDATRGEPPHLGERSPRRLPQAASCALRCRSHGT